jgi:amino acid permease
MIYFIVFGDTFSSIVRNIFYSGLALDQTNIFTSRLFYVVTLGLFLTPVILRKEMKELKCVSITLMLSICAFMLIFILQLL